MSCQAALCPVRAAAAMPTLPKPGTRCRPGKSLIRRPPRDPRGVARSSRPRTTGAPFGRGRVSSGSAPSRCRLASEGARPRAPAARCHHRLAVARRGDQENHAHPAAGPDTAARLPKSRPRAASRAIWSQRDPDARRSRAITSTWSRRCSERPRGGRRATSLTDVGTLFASGLNWRKQLSLYSRDRFTVVGADSVHNSPGRDVAVRPGLLSPPVFPGFVTSARGDGCPRATLPPHKRRPGDAEWQACGRSGVWSAGFHNRRGYRARWQSGNA
jgi:hypothetical protein